MEAASLVSFTDASPFFYCRITTISPLPYDFTIADRYLLRMNTRQRKTRNESDSITLTRQEKGLQQVPALPRQRAFVVQLYAYSTVDTAHISGRVEHVSSGLATHFASWNELADFIARVLQSATVPFNAQTGEEETE